MMEPKEKAILLVGKKIDAKLKKYLKDNDIAFSEYDDYKTYKNALIKGKENIVIFLDDMDRTDDIYAFRDSSLFPGICHIMNFKDNGDTMSFRNAIVKDELCSFSYETIGAKAFWDKFVAF